MKHIHRHSILLLLGFLFSCAGGGGNTNPSTSIDTTEPDIIDVGELEKDPEDTSMSKEDRLYSELWRPQYHFTDPDSWLNDPNGLVYADGIWHLYYQATPHQNTYGNKYWGHAISEDLVHWQFLDYPLRPDGTGDMWSGTAVADPENHSGLFEDNGHTGIIAAYSTHRQTVGIAYSEDGGMTFNKFSTSSPIIPNPGANDFRDPCLFYYPEDETWKIVIAGGYLRVYESENLYDWRQCSVNTSIQTECPCFFKMVTEDTGEEKWVLTCGARGYYVGSFDGQRFTPETKYIEMNSGLDSYAGIIFNDAPNNRIIMLNWMSSIVTQCWQAEGKWNQQMTLPLEFKLYSNGNGYLLKQNPVSELNILREKVLLDIADVDASETDVLEGIESNTFEMKLKVDVSKTNNFDLVLASDKQGTDEIRIRYEKKSRKLILDRSNNKYGFSNMTTVNNRYNFTLSAKTFEDNTLDLHLYFDVNCVELFVNGGTRYIPMKCNPFTSSRAMSLTGDSLYIKQLKVFEMRSSYFNYKEDINGVHLASESTLYVPVGETNQLEVASFNGSALSIENLNPTLFSASLNHNFVEVNGLAAGTGKIKVINGLRYKEVEVTVYDPNDQHLINMLGELNTNNASIEQTPFGLHMSTPSGDGFAISTINLADFTYSSKVTIHSGSAAALIFRASGTSSFYCFNVDNGGKFYKLWKRMSSGFADLQVVSDSSIKLNKQYELKVVCAGSSIKCYVDGVLKISVTDSSFASGQLGLNVFNADATFSEIIYQ